MFRHLLRPPARDLPRDGTAQSPRQPTAEPGLTEPRQPVAGREHAWRVRVVNCAVVLLLAGAALLYVAPAFSPGLRGVEVTRSESRPAPVLLAAAAPAPASAPSAAAATAASSPSPPGPVVGAVPRKDLPKPEKHAKLIDDFFAEPQIPSITIELKAEDWEFLKKDPRRYAECTVNDADGKVFKNVAVKLKGAAGSFQGPEAKPGLTLNFDKFKGASRFRGMTKLHLNNGAQDPTYLMELIAGEMCRKAGIPASRCSQAIVKWQGRDLGLYVVKEAFTREFLAKFFADPTGDLYDGGFCRELDGTEEKDLGDEKERDNIKELVAACREGDTAKRWARLEAILDVEKFITFTAMEAITGHWDGYNFNRNNYRVYFDATSKKAIFFAHGLDQPFNDPNFPVIRDSGAMVGQAVFSNPAWKAKYRERVQEIYEKVIEPIDWPARVTEAGNAVKAALEKKNPQLAKDYAGQIANARGRVEQRIAALGKQLGAIPKPLHFSPQGVAKIEPKGWRPEGGGAEITEAQGEGRPVFRIKANGTAAASWRKNLALEPGRYRFEARLRTIGVQPAPGPSGEGAGVRISGSPARTAENAAKGDVPWQTVAYQFTAPGGDVVLVAELRASKGEAWFDKDSFQIVRVQ